MIYMSNVVVLAFYTVPEDDDLQTTLEWLSSEHYDDLRRVLRLESYQVSGRDDQAQVIMTVDANSWDAYISGPDRKAIAAAAKAHGFDSARVTNEYANFSDDDRSPFGHGPESRGGNPESERGFSGESRG